MQVRILERCNAGIGVGGRKPGTILDVPGGTGQTWIDQGKAELVTDHAGDEKMVPSRDGSQRMKRGR